jgi:hypothetical protein
LDLQLPMQSVPITTKVVSLIPVHGEVYSMQHYVIKVVSDLRFLVHKDLNYLALVLTLSIPMKVISEMCHTH